MPNETYPYNDESMFYDYNQHRYILTPECVLNELNINLSERLNKRGSASGENVASSILNRISSIVYNEIYAHSEFNDAQEYILAKYKSARPIIKEAMKCQVLYFLINGDVGNFSGIDFKKNSVIDIDKIRGRAILSPDSEKILYRTIRELGVSILYQGQYNIYRTFDYDRDNY